MPLHQLVDVKGKYYKWGHHGRKYYYKDLKTEIRALKRILAHIHRINYKYHGF